MATEQEPLPQRVSRLEGGYEHLATKADVGEVKVEIARLETRILRWLLPSIVAGIAAAGAVSRLLS